jgi:hypothetical protein
MACFCIESNACMRYLCYYNTILVAKCEHCDHLSFAKAVGYVWVLRQMSMNKLSDYKYWSSVETGTLPHHTTYNKLILHWLLARVEHAHGFKNKIT